MPTDSRFDEFALGDVASGSPDTNTNCADDPDVISVLVAREDQCTPMSAPIANGHDMQVEIVSLRDVHPTVTASNPDVLVIQVVEVAHAVGICRRVRADADTRLLPVVVVARRLGGERLEALAAGANDVLIDQVDRAELRLRLEQLAQFKRYTDDLEPAAAVLMTMAAMVDARATYREGHCHRMANYAVAIGQALGVSRRELLTLRRGAFLHDIGMLIVPDHVLGKTTALEPEEYDLIKQHTVYGEGLVRELRALRTVGPIIRHHHERRDGSGYPDGLVGDAIPLLAQIIGIVDVFEAVTSPRAYRGAGSPADALRLLTEHVARGWRRPDLVAIFTDVVRQRGIL